MDANRDTRILNAGARLHRALVAQSKKSSCRNCVGAPFGKTIDEMR